MVNQHPQSQERLAAPRTRIPTTRIILTPTILTPTIRISRILKTYTSIVYQVMNPLLVNGSPKGEPRPEKSRREAHGGTDTGHMASGDIIEIRITFANVLRRFQLNRCLQREPRSRPL